MLPPATTKVTETIISTKPAISLPPSVSPNIVIPKNTAVSGSRAPRIAVAVEPMYTIAFVAQYIESTVGNNAKAKISSHRYHLVGV